MPYLTLSGARDFDFNAVSDLTAKISYLLKAATNLNIQEREESQAQNAYTVNKDRQFVPKVEDPLNTVIDILDDEYVEHKKELHPYVPLQVETADEIERETQLADDKFAQLKAEYNQINDLLMNKKIKTK